ncbi:MAG: D-glycero-beta-D-manno-heptose 1-phosphate adenylyltransferase [Bacteroidetes bacterium]|nr:D-glycero-beta-D-manno-heptose 1-phosphate adenylyltransferase [Bacteroidota bacterium]
MADYVFRSFDDAKESVANFKNRKQRIVFTNGCFDILHKGHVTYLNEAAALGDVLIVGLNSDDSVKKLKGASRPVNDWAARATVLASLKMVDAVICFEDDTPETLIAQVIPDVLVKGGDYKLHEIVGAGFVQQNGGQVVIIDLVKGFSTSTIISKIENQS